MDRSDGQKVMTAQVMFAHHIDYAMRAEEEELRGRDGEPNGWYFTERYVLQDFSDFEPDPMECAVYIVRQQEKALFDEVDYLITDFGDFAAAYPRSVSYTHLEKAEEAEKAPAHGDPAAGACRAAAGGGALGRALRDEPVCSG